MTCIASSFLSSAYTIQNNALHRYGTRKKYVVCFFLLNRTVAFKYIVWYYLLAVLAYCITTGREVTLYSLDYLHPQLAWFGRKANFMCSEFLLVSNLNHPSRFYAA